MVWSLIKEDVNSIGSNPWKKEQKMTLSSIGKRRDTAEQGSEQVTKKLKATKVSSSSERSLAVAHEHSRARGQGSKERTSNAGSTPVRDQVSSPTAPAMGSYPAPPRRPMIKLRLTQDRPTAVQTTPSDSSDLSTTSTDSNGPCSLDHDPTRETHVKIAGTNLVSAAAQPATPQRVNEQSRDQVPATNSAQPHISKSQRTQGSNEQREASDKATTPSQQPVPLIETSATPAMAQGNTPEKDHQTSIAVLHNTLAKALKEATSAREQHGTAMEALKQAQEQHDTAGISLEQADHNVKILCGSISMGTLSDEPAQLQARLVEYVQRATAAREAKETEARGCLVAHEQVDRAEKAVVEADQKVDELYWQVVGARVDDAIDGE